MKTLRYAPGGVAALLILTLALVTSASGIAAQATPTTGGDAVAHPAHIHAGSCPEVGDVVFPLEDVAPVSAIDAVAATPEATSQAVDITGEGLAESTTEVEATLDDILAAEHAINVHASAEDIETYIACGDVTATPTDGELQIQLMELNGSGFAGEAHLVDNGDGTTTVTVMLMASAGATPAATPAG
jgi:hypothetical protein